MFKLLLVSSLFLASSSNAAKLSQLLRAPPRGNGQRLQAQPSQNNYNYAPPQPPQPPQQGYNYEPPQQPAGLYELPSNPVSSTIPPPPPPPSSLYEIPQATNLISEVQRPQVDMPMGMNPMPYEFDWAVNDEESGNQYSQKETQDGNVLRGEYRVLLPNGKTQVVTYFDDGNGFNAKVTYE